jgi:hypothetical protein
MAAASTSRDTCTADHLPPAQQEPQRLRPPFGFCRRSPLANATRSGLSSAWLLRPSHLPTSLLALTGTAQLCDQASLFVFGKGTCDLAHHLAGRITAVGQIIARCREHAHPPAGSGR